MGGLVGGWVYELKIRLNSASVVVEVEVEAELGNYHTFETLLKGAGTPSMVKDHKISCFFYL